MHGAPCMQRSGVRRKSERGGFCGAVFSCCGSRCKKVVACWQ